MRFPPPLNVLCITATLLAPSMCGAQAAPRLDGDVGVALFRTPAITHTADAGNAVLPYFYADYGAWYGRVDTFGYKAAPLGRGHLELAARVSLEGYRPADPRLRKRSTPLPVGVGTLQETPVGALFLYALRDSVSGGTLLDATYAVEWSAGPVHVYPQVGVERRSARYVRRLYGVSDAESVRSGVRSYAAGASLSPNAGLAIEYDLTRLMKVTAQVRARWLDHHITDSPLVNARTQTAGVLALTRSFR